ncbi:MAG TPA: hypothetical protein VEG29_01955 [Candidatus Binatia bacterium]|nr:hypothetical protein [Candidatus Binatia bacterium]
MVGPDFFHNSLSESDDAGTAARTRGAGEAVKVPAEALGDPGTAIGVGEPGIATLELSIEAGPVAGGGAVGPPQAARSDTTAVMTTAVESR